MNFFKKFNKLKNDYKDNNISVVSLLVCLFGVLALTFGTSYAYLSYTAYAEEENYISAGTLLLNFNDNSDAIYMSNAVPQRDLDALENNPEYSFTIRNNGTLNAKYEVRLVNVCNEGIATTSGDVDVTPDVCIPLEYIKVGVKQGDSEYAVASLTNDGKFYIGNGTLDANASSIEYKIKIWLDERTPDDYQSELNGVTRTVTFVGQLEIYGEQMPTDTYAVGAISLADAIKAQGVVSSGNGLYVSTATNDGRPTYYYKGAVENNYVQFGTSSGNSACSIKEEYSQYADLFSLDNMGEYECTQTGYSVCHMSDGGSFQTYSWSSGCEATGGTMIADVLEWKVQEKPLLWRVVRINEDGSIRLIMEDSAVLSGHGLDDSSAQSPSSMYLSERFNDWTTMEGLFSNYGTVYNIDTTLMVSSEFCEAAKTKHSSESTFENADMVLYSEYTPDFTCKPDGNGYSIATMYNNGSDKFTVGLLSLDELLMAGGNIKENNSFYLANGNATITVSPGGMDTYYAGVWYLNNNSVIDYTTFYNPGGDIIIRPVISVKNNVTVTGTGSSGDPWVVQTN